MMIDSPGISATMSARFQPFAFAPFSQQKVALHPLVVAGARLGPLGQGVLDPFHGRDGLFSLSVTVFAFSVAMKSTFVAT